MASRSKGDLTEHQQNLVIDILDERIEEQSKLKKIAESEGKGNQGRKRAQEILDFVSAKVQKHIEGIKHHAERLEIYQFIAEDLELVHCRYTPEESTASEEEVETTTRAPPIGARCRFTPDSEEEDADSNAERVRNLGETLGTVKQEDDKGGDWLNKKQPAKESNQATKKAQIAQDHQKARAWAAERPPNPRVYSSPANLKAVQEQEKKKKGRK
jgi:hypothetical protein